MLNFCCQLRFDQRQLNQVPQAGEVLREDRDQGNLLAPPAYKAVFLSKLAKHPIEKVYFLREFLCVVQLCRRANNQIMAIVAINFISTVNFISEQTIKASSCRTANEWQFSGTQMK